LVKPKPTHLFGLLSYFIAPPLIGIIESKIILIKPLAGLGGCSFPALLEING
jgi:hypothetical protein